MTRPWLAIIGVTEAGEWSAEAAALLAAASLVLGGARHLALAAPLISGETMAWQSPIAETIPLLLARRGQPVVVLASGDPLWFGVGSLLLRHVPRNEMHILPAISAFALAAARLGWALQDTACLSCCGRPVEAIIPHLQQGARLLILSADETTPQAIQQLLQGRGFANSAVWILEALGGPAERVRHGLASDDLGEVGPLNMMAVEAKGLGLPLTPGLDDELFEHDGQITKREIRAMTLAALQPRPGEMLWDIGCGSGSVAIEWCLRHASCQAVGVERRADRAARAERNAKALGATNLKTVVGDAPASLAGLPWPDAVFLGGGAQTPGVLEATWSSLRPGGRLVANAIALASEAALMAAQTRLGGTLTRVALERLDMVGAMAAFRPAMTVTQWRVLKP